ncbi:MAG: hypothetical protein ABIP90_03165, partial [Vicinamibacterales bacterium]
MTPAATQRLTAAWAAALFLLPVQAVTIIPWLGGRVQPPDLAILVVAAGALHTWWRLGWPPPAALDVAIVWPLAAAIALYLSGQARSPMAALEVVGALYLLVLYFVIRLTATHDRIDKFFDWYPASVGCAALLGLVGA